MYIQNIFVKGAIDSEKRCKHYHSKKDRVAIKFACCKDFFPCYLCHREHGCGKEEVWPIEDFSEQAILCGSCDNKLTIKQYLEDGTSCPTCDAAFNPACSIHEHLYFETLS